MKRYGIIKTENIHFEKEKCFLNKKVKFDNGKASVGFFTVEYLSINLKIDPNGEIERQCWLCNKNNSCFQIEFCEIVN